MSWLGTCFGIQTHEIHFLKNTSPGQQLWRATGTGIKLSLFFVKVNELELSVTFRWMANTKLTEQYVFCYITSMVQLYAPEPALQRGHSHHCCIFWLRATFLLPSTHWSCDPWAFPGAQCFVISLATLLSPWSRVMHQLPLRVLLIGKYSWVPTTWRWHSKEPPSEHVMNASFYIKNMDIYCDHACLQHTHCSLRTAADEGVGERAA